MYQSLLFDLDGTITESAPGILNSVEYALNSMNHPIPDKETLNLFIGPPLSYSFKTYCQMDDSTSELAVKKYRERYNSVGLFESELYDGIVEVLQFLKAQGKHLYIATAKPEPLAKKILEHYQLDDLFEDIVGATYDGTIGTKTQVIKHLFERNPNLNPEQSVMIGDRNHDIEGAHQNHINSIGVLYGYGDEAELSQSGATVIIQTPSELIDVLTS